MDIPFPVTTPRFIDSKWFSADTPCDEDAELTALEQSNQNWLSNVGQQYKARAPLGKADPEPMEECESEEEEDSVQIVEDSDEVEEEPEPPNMNHDVDLLQVHEDSSHDDEAGNMYNEQDVTEKIGDESDDDLDSAQSPPSRENWGDDVDDHNVCCGDTAAGNDESDESEESHDEDEEEDLQQSYPPQRSEQTGRTLDLTDSSEPNLSDQGTLWP